MKASLAYNKRAHQSGNCFHYMLLLVLRPITYLNALTKLWNADSGSINSDEAFAEWKKKNNAKDCPKCGCPSTYIFNLKSYCTYPTTEILIQIPSIVQKTEGCNHMECGVCKADLCWICLKVFSDGGEAYEHLDTEHAGHYDPEYYRDPDPWGEGAVPEAIPEGMQDAWGDGAVPGAIREGMQDAWGGGAVPGAFPEAIQDGWGEGAVPGAFPEDI